MRTKNKTEHIMHKRKNSLAGNFGSFVISNYLCIHLDPIIRPPDTGANSVSGHIIWPDTGAADSRPVERNQLFHVSVSGRTDAGV